MIALAPDGVGGGGLSGANGPSLDLTPATPDIQPQSQPAHFFVQTGSTPTVNAESGEDTYSKGLLLAREMVATLACKAGLRRIPTLEVNLTTARVNATGNVTPFRGLRTIVLTRSALEISSPRLEALLAHEIGHSHIYRRLLWRFLGLPCLTGCATTAILSSTMPATLVYVLGVVGYELLTLPCWEERAADRIAVRLTGNPLALIGLLDQIADGAPSHYEGNKRIEQIEKRIQRQEIWRKRTARFPASVQAFLKRFLK